MIRRSVLCAVALALSGWTSTLSFGSPQTFQGLGMAKAYPASIIALLSQPETFEGKLVAVEGYLMAEWEGPVLYLSSEHCAAYSYDGVGLEFSSAVAPNWKRLSRPNCRRVRVEGVYESIRYVDPSPDVYETRRTHGVLRNISYLDVQ